MKAKTIVVAVMTVALAGCKPDAGSPKPIYAVVNGSPITVEYASNAVMVIARTLELAGRPVQQKNFGKWANRTATAQSRRLLASEMMDQALKIKGVKTDDRSDSETLAKYAKATKREYGSIDELAKEYGALEDTFRVIFAKASRLAAYIAHSGVMEISEGEVDKFLEGQKELIENCERINKSALEKGDKAWARLEAGESWDIVAKECSEDKITDSTCFWKEWETFRLKDFFLPEVVAALSGKEKGFYTHPLDTDQGLLIVKVTEKEDDVYTCARILVRMTNVPEMPTREEALQKIKSERRSNLQEELLSEFRDSAEIVFPNGTNNVLRVWKEG